MTAFSRLAPQARSSVKKPATQKPVASGSRSRRNSLLTLIGIVLITAFAGIITYPGTLPGVLDSINQFPPRLGLDLSGGAQLIYRAVLDQVPSDQQAEALAGARDVIERRVNAFGVSEAVVQTSGNDRLLIELPGITDVREAIARIGETPILEFKTENPAYGKTVTLAPDQQKQLDALNADVKKKADQVLQEVLANNGATFADLAKKYSDDPGSAQQGGELPFVRKGQFVPEFDKAIFTDLKKGEISRTLIKSDFGYHIIQKLDERVVDDKDKDGKKIQVTEVKSRHILIKTKNSSDMVPTPDEWLSSGLSGKNLSRASVTFDQTTGQPQVQLSFDAAGADLFKKLTTDNLNKRIAIFLDGQSISAPVVRSAITNGVAVISGDFTVAEARELARKLNAGALPVPVVLDSQQTVGPALGQESLDKSLRAGVIGLIAVVLFMIAIYRLPGVLSVIALGVYSVLVLAIFETIGVTLTLAGIAGFILSIGMAVDANILIFSRLREELRSGKTLDDAIDEGFRRAWSSIRDSNISSLITCTILLWFGTSIVQGFAVTLGIGILVSMFTAITVTRTLLHVLPKGSRRFGWLFGGHFRS